MKTKVVVFDNTGARLLTNPPPPVYLGKPHLVNPDISTVENHPPHKWDLVAGKVALAGAETVKQREDAAEVAAEQAHQASVKAALKVLVSAPPAKEKLVKEMHVIHESVPLWHYAGIVTMSLSGTLLILWHLNLLK